MADNDISNDLRAAMTFLHSVMKGRETDLKTMAEEAERLLYAEGDLTPGELAAAAMLTFAVNDEFPDEVLRTETSVIIEGRACR
jgi:hypothetical protein